MFSRSTKGCGCGGIIHGDAAVTGQLHHFSPLPSASHQAHQPPSASPHRPSHCSPLRTLLSIMFHPAPTRVISVPTLEQAATLSTTQFNVAAPTSNMPPPPPPPSAAGNNLSIVSKRSSRKGRKRLRTEPEDEERPCYPQPLEELLKMTVIQLKKVAADNSKHAMSAKDKQFFLDFYQEQEQMMAIKAIERGVSLPMVHAILEAYVSRGTLIRVPNGTLIRVLGTLIRVLGTLIRVLGTLIRVPGTLIRVPGTLIRSTLGTLIRVPGTLGTLIRAPRGSRKPLDLRGLREPGRTGVHGQHACPAGPHAKPAVLTPFAFGGACARPSGVPLSSPFFLLFLTAECDSDLYLLHLNVRGRRVAFKEANRWNRFLQTNQARLIFQRSGLGVKDKAVMNELSKAYNQLSEEEKAALTNVTDDPSANDEQNLDHDGDGSADPSQPPGQRAITRGTVSPRIRWEQANAAMDRWLSESCSCEVVIFAVSNHLGSHSFQLSQTTPGASAPHKAITNIDGNHQYTARLQAYIAGVDITSLAMAQKVSANPDLLRSQLHQLTQAMAKFVNNETGGILKEWPWTDTDHNLWVAGYGLEISACPAFNIQWLRSPTRARHLVEVRIFMRELREKRIHLVPRTNNETEPSWATVLKTNKCPTCGRESHLHNLGGDAASLLDTTAPASSHANN
ncbi:hypothetical protein PCANC_01226 [Puccinia coronata f. sp. avenae]|uniref:Uncharacterized protein n=1 Tax=Puccinia coronata f. sp. avenae TaxID=200324 RepID=A0A2N5W3V4_9BASI|nr:hypothetical protein PCANC_01226 [Puccinia coronata f. sp. avenae]